MSTLYHIPFSTEVDFKRILSALFDGGFVLGPERVNKIEAVDEYLKKRGIVVPSAQYDHLLINYHHDCKAVLFLYDGWCEAVRCTVEEFLEKHAMVVARDRRLKRRR